MKLYVKVKPSSKSDSITRGFDGAIQVKIKAQPVDGKANLYLVKYFSSILNLPTSKILLAKGQTSSFKTLEIDAEESYVAERISKAIS